MVDTDNDGLTDEFEKLARTSPTSADTDEDGLSDGYEALESRSDPLSVDTDDGGSSDAREVALGTDAGSLPGTAGVVGSGALAENVRDDVSGADKDGLSDHAEKVLRTDADKVDTDADGLSDAVDVQYGEDPLAPGSTLGVGAVPGGTAGVGGDPAYGQDGHELGPTDLGGDDALGF